MKKALCTALAALMLVACLASCTSAPTANAANAHIRMTSSDAADAAAWLEARLGERLTDSVVLGTSSEGFGVSLDALENDGYVIRALGSEIALLARTTEGLDRAVREYAKSVESGAAVLNETYHEGYRVGSLTVCGDDISSFAVVTDDDADQCQLFAASELVSYIEKTCGAKLETYTAGEYDALEAKPKAIRLTVDYPALGDEAFRITVGEDGITVAGGRYRGCMYGVYDLLEDIGWRFVYSPVDTDAEVIEHLYESERVDLDQSINREEHPAISYRTIWRGRTSNDKIDVKFRNFSHYADPTAPSSAIYGDYGLTGVACHGLHSKGWLNEMSEMGLFSGSPDTNQPCYTDPDVIDFAIEKALSLVESQVNAGLTIGKEITTVDVSQPDNGNFCRCKRCMDAIRYDGSDSGPVLRFTNAVAEALAAEYPGVSASMLAYAGTNVPTLRTKPLDNVRISYCIYVGQGDFTCSRHSVSGEECTPGGVNNVKFGSELAGWAALCTNDNLDVWYYPFNCYGTGFDSPITDQIFESMKWLTSLGCVNGMMYHGGRATGTLLQALNAYLGSKLMWNADMTKDEYDAIIKEWFDICYGDSADYIYPYFKQCLIAANMTSCWSSFYSDNTDKVDNEYMAAHFDKWWDDFNLALAAADSAKQQEWVERYMGGMLYICCGLTYEDRYTNGDEGSRAAFVERYELLHTIFRKYQIHVYDNLMTYELAPAQFDPEISPFDWAVDGRV